MINDKGTLNSSHYIDKQSLLSVEGYRPPSPPVQQKIQVKYRIIESQNHLSWKGPLKAIQSNPPATNRVTYSQSTLLRAPSNLTLNVFRDGETTSLGNMFQCFTTLKVKNNKQKESYSIGSSYLLSNETSFALVLKWASPDATELTGSVRMPPHEERQMCACKMRRDLTPLASG